MKHLVWLTLLVSLTATGSELGEIMCKPVVRLSKDALHTRHTTELSYKETISHVDSQMLDDVMRAMYMDVLGDMLQAAWNSDPDTDPEQFGQYWFRKCADQGHFNY